MGYSNNENYLGSDSYALKSMTNKISYLDDGDVCVLTKDQIEFYDSKKNKKKKVLILSEDKNENKLGDFKKTLCQKRFLNSHLPLQIV